MRSPSDPSPRRRPRWLLLAASLWVALQVTACDSATTEPPPQPDPPAPTLSISNISSLTPGQTAQVRGQLLDEITEFVVDGVPVTFSATSPTAGSFVVPEFRACETDGRRVRVEANQTIQRDERLELTNTLRMAAGESRILTAEDLSCLQIGRGLESYLITLADFRTRHPEGVGYNDVKESIHSPLTLLARGTGEAPPIVDPPDISVGVVDGAAYRTRPEVLNFPDARAIPYEPGMGPPEGEFDNYSGAEVGDTLRFVHWSYGGEVRWRQAETKDDVPTYRGLVIAATDHILAIAPLDQPDLPGGPRDMGYLLTDANRVQIEAASRVSEALTLPALQHVLGPQMYMPQGAGGRQLVFFQPARAGWLGSSNSRDMNRNARWASDVFTIYLSEVLLTRRPEDLARVMIHEFAHSGERLYSQIAQTGEGGGARVGLGWYSEAFAVSVEDAASRISRGDLYGAPAGPSTRRGEFNHRILPGVGPALPYYRVATPIHAPFLGGRGNNLGGEYRRGAQILRYAQQAMGPGREWELHAELERRGREEALAGASWDDIYDGWNVSRIAEVAGLTTEELLERSMLADATIGLVTREDAQAQGLPILEGWRWHIDDLDRWFERREDVLSRDREHTAPFASHPSGYSYRWIPGDALRGVSLQAVAADLEDYNRIRITRLR